MNINELVQDELDELIGIYKHFHANPELSREEKETSKVVADHLESCGISVTRNFGGYGIVGILENGDGPTVMLRADMDALPITEQSGLDYASQVTTLDSAGNKVGVMHACGHDVHMTALIGAARMLTKTLDSWSGRILFVGQPAEESITGARAMLDEGLFDRFGVPDYCLATHVGPKIEAGKIAVRPGPIMAGTCQLKITVNGVGGHGAIPHESRDPIVLAARIITSFQTIVSREFNPLKPAVVTVGSIHGGTRANIIPDKVDMEVTVRFFDSESRDRIYESIKRICRHEALSMEIPDDLLPIVEFDKENELPATINDSGLVEVIKEVVLDQLGKDKCTEAEMIMGSEDFSLFRTAVPQGIPCCLFFSGATSTEEMNLLTNEGINPPSLHNNKFYPPPAPTIHAATITMTASVIKLLSKI